MATGTWIGAWDGAQKFVDLDKAQALYPADNGDGTWIVFAQYSDFALKVQTGVTYTSEQDAIDAISAYLGAALSASF